MFRRRSGERRKELFDTFCIGEFAEVKVANLSTGMKQKASLAISWFMIRRSLFLTSLPTAWTC